MKRRSLLAVLVWGPASAGAHGHVSGIRLRSRVFVPYTNGDDYAYNMGASEQMAYDPVEQYVYAVSEQGYINVVDMSDPSHLRVVPELAPDLSTLLPLTDIELCPKQGLVFAAGEDGGGARRGRVYKLTTVKRGRDSKMKLLAEAEVGFLPDCVMPNKECTMLAVANEAEGVYDAAGLFDEEVILITRMIYMMMMIRPDGYSISHSLPTGLAQRDQRR